MDERQAKIHAAVLRVLTNEWQSPVTIARASGVAWQPDAWDMLNAMHIRGEIERTPLSTARTMYRLRAS